MEIDVPKQSFIEKNAKGEDVIPAELRSDTISYAIQSFVYNLGANTYEPIVSSYTQKKACDWFNFSGYSNYRQNLGGEFAGDVIGTATLVAAETFAPNQLHSFTKTARKMVHPLYSSVANWLFSDQKNNPGYDEKIKQWTTYQERNLVRALITTSAAMVGNIATQKLLCTSKAPSGIIFLGRMVSKSLTTALGLTARFTFPKQAGAVDHWMSEHIFAKIMSDAVVNDPNLAASHTEKVRARRQSDNTPSLSA